MTYWSRTGLQKPSESMAVDVLLWLLVVFALLFVIWLVTGGR